MPEAAPVWQWLLPRTDGLGTVREPPVRPSDRPDHHALNVRTHSNRECAVPGPSIVYPPDAASSERRPPESAHEGRRENTEPSGTDTVSDVVRWAAFSCVLVPVVLVGYGISLAGAAGAALGLAAVTGACRALLRQSERCAARPAPVRSCGHRGRRGGTVPGARKGGHRTG
jgi:hypothetical protein